MNFCMFCGRAMQHDFSTGSVDFICYCGAKKKGTDADCRISGGVSGITESADISQELIRTAAFDPTNQLVARDCEKCGLDYMTQLRVGATETVILKCKCGNVIKGGKTMA